MDRLLKRKEVETLTGLSRSSLYRWIERGQFPKPLRLSARTVRWEASTIDDWVKQLPNTERKVKTCQFQGLKP